MDERIPQPPLFQYSPSGIHSSPHHNNPLRSSASERERYLAELLAERQKLAPFMQVLPFCNRLLNQEILRASSLPPNANFVEPERIDHGSPSPLRLAGHPMNGQPMDLEGWSGMQTKHLGVLQSSSMSWNGAPGVVGNPVVKKVVRIDVPVDKYPNEDKFRDKPGYEHLNDPLHVLVEAEFPADIVDSRLNQAVAILEDLLKPVDESMDYYKKQQLRELAILNGTLREESPGPHLSPSVSPFNSTGMKRAKTGR
ncbi:KH domain-containing protein At1g09660/At1g09670-like isoform X2 [Phragmites australis]|uniref:KH domain-containing protein At1g09660/At1g09670-like isoform X2 n=1 Tax=Phragmites australis TaxID=29695 RepID=UPI002D788225|nr:KH domain-containing protein At1g09660/At1g09670-like isoform X2 [Phragmites australis]